MAIGLFIYATSFSQFGLMGAAFIVPLPFFCFVLYRTTGIIKNLATIGTFFDKKNSNVID